MYICALCNAVLIGVKRGSSNLRILELHCESPVVHDGKQTKPSLGAASALNS